MSRMKAVRSIAELANLIEIRVRQLQAELTIEPEELFDRDCEIQASWNASYRFDEANSRLRVQIPASVSLREVGAPSESAELVKFSVEFSIDYDLNPPVPAPPEREELFSAFASINGMYNAWPYLREVIQSLSTRMGLPPLLLPVLRVSDIKRDDTPKPTAPRMRLVSGGGGR